MRRGPGPRHGGRTGRTRRRHLVTAAVAVVAVASSLLGAKLAVMHVATSRGLDELRRGDHVDAEWSFRVNLVANWFQPWRAHFNLGVALYGQGKWPQAQEQFSAALDRAPEGKRCIVALNLAWSYEAEGDQLSAMADPVGAVERWKEAEAVARDAGCEYTGPDDEEDRPEDGDGTDPERGSEARSEADLTDDRTEGTPEEQQERTEQRSRAKATDAEARAADQRAGEQEGGQDQPSDESRLEDLRAGNQRSQEQRQQSTGQAEGEVDGAGRAETGDGKPSW